MLYSIKYVLDCLYSSWDPIFDIYIHIWRNMAPMCMVFNFFRLFFGQRRYGLTRSNNPGKPNILWPDQVYCLKARQIYYWLARYNISGQGAYIIDKPGILSHGEPTIYYRLTKYNVSRQAKYIIDWPGIMSQGKAHIL